MPINNLATTAANRGANAAIRGLPYSGNPYSKTSQPELHLVWSESHNGMRARMIMDKESFS